MWINNPVVHVECYTKAVKPISRTSYGFTLIELLVVVAIISLLSSVVLASLNSARDKAKDAAILASANQLAIIMEQEYGVSGSYANLQPVGGQWVSNPGIFQVSWDCTATNIMMGSFASTVTELCQSIYKNTGLTNGSGFFMGNSVSNINNYSFMMYLPGKKTYYCIGSSGRKSDNTPANLPNLTNPGCRDNP